MNFASDNVYGVHPRILASLTEANAGTAASYASDDWSKRAEAKLSEVFEKEVQAFLVLTGTAANGLALSTLTPGYGAILCHAEAHICVDECNSPELFTGGAKLIGLKGPDGKLTPDLISRTLKGFIRGEHDPKPCAVSITNATELGTLYSVDDVKAISSLIEPRGMKLHMDGARFGNAVAGLGVAPADITWKAGVDALSFGATKNGAMILEAVVFFDPEIARDFAHVRMRAGQLISKSRYLGAQMLAYLENDLWLENARRANASARRLADLLSQSNTLRLAYPVQANEVFAVMPRSLGDRLVAQGANFHEWMADSLGEGGIGDDEMLARFVLSYATPAADIERFGALIKDAA
ncbi:low specificity L-threonine aldolase [soil metagenome]